MRRALLSATIIAAMTLAASAEMIDLSTMTCSKFQASSKDEIGIILTWLDAYYRDDDDPDQRIDHRDRQAVQQVDVRVA